jgi:hypothetical protein
MIKQRSVMGLSRGYDDGGDEIKGDGYPKQLEVETLESSLGWWPLPKVKLASTWDPDDEKQWLVSTSVCWNHGTHSEVYDLNHNECLFV